MKTKGKILVTGGAGFIGAHLCQSLLERDEQVLCFDNFSTSRRDSIASLLQNPGFQALEHDVMFHSRSKRRRYSILPVPQARYSTRKIL